MWFMVIMKVIKLNFTENDTIITLSTAEFRYLSIRIREDICIVRLCFSRLYFYAARDLVHNFTWVCDENY